MATAPRSANGSWSLHWFLRSIDLMIYEEGVTGDGGLTQQHIFTEVGDYMSETNVNLVYTLTFYT